MEMCTCRLWWTCSTWARMWRRRWTHPGSTISYSPWTSSMRMEPLRYSMLYSRRLHHQLFPMNLFYEDGTTTVQYAIGHTQAPPPPALPHEPLLWGWNHYGTVCYRRLHHQLFPMNLFYEDGTTTVQYAIGHTQAPPPALPHEPLLWGQNHGRSQAPPPALHHEPILWGWNHYGTVCYRTHPGSTTSSSTWTSSMRTETQRRLLYRIRVILKKI